ncbi:hypothetical protein HK101_001048 [Irineochytrium annulatum]|nr:hypothetical protein HK101_001048 [Irineochytrium annulatum]
MSASSSPTRRLSLDSKTAPGPAANPIKYRRNAGLLLTFASFFILLSTFSSISNTSEAFIDSPNDPSDSPAVVSGSPLSEPPHTSPRPGSQAHAVANAVVSATTARVTTPIVHHDASWTPPAGRFDRQKSDDDDPARELAWFRARVHPRHDTVMIVPVNGGAMPLATNMLCSLIRNAGPDIVDSLVFWAMDATAAEKLTEIREGMLNGSYFDVGTAKGRRAEEDGVGFGKNGTFGKDDGGHDYASTTTSASGAALHASTAFTAASPAMPTAVAAASAVHAVPIGLIQDPKSFAKGANRALFGIYYDPTLSTSMTGLVNGLNDGGNYYHMMSLRLNFFVRVSKTLGLNFIFSDADIYYIADPFSDLNLPYGVPDPLNRTTTDYYRDLPDIIYSTDARGPYHTLSDPWEGQARIPKICGGFFFARANERTARLYTKLRDLNWNDQWGVDGLLNGDMFEAVMVDPLPAGIKERKPFVRGKTEAELRAEEEKQKAEEEQKKVGSRKRWWKRVENSVDPDKVMRIRILSQAAYTNALVQYAPVGTRGPGFHKYVKELHERGEKEVLYHPNYWKNGEAPSEDDLARGHWVWSDNKTLIFEAVDMWKMNGNQCMLTLD